MPRSREASPPASLPDQTSHSRSESNLFAHTGPSQSNSIASRRIILIFIQLLVNSNYVTKSQTHRSHRIKEAHHHHRRRRRASTWEMNQFKLISYYFITFHKAPSEMWGEGRQAKRKITKIRIHSRRVKRAGEPDEGATCAAAGGRVFTYKSKI